MNQPLAYTETEWPRNIRANSNLLPKPWISEATRLNASAICFLPRNVLGLGDIPFLGIVIDSIKLR